MRFQQGRPQLGGGQGGGVVGTQVRGGETRVFDANGPHGLRFVMQEPLTTLLLDDARVIHETTPIFPNDGSTANGHRDTLVLTYRAAGFQAP